MRCANPRRFPALLLAWMLGLVPAVGGAEEVENLSDNERMELGTQLWDGRPTVFQQCPKVPGAPDKFALCATSTCVTLDQVAYCKCNVLHQDSISLPFPYQEDGTRKDICDLLLAGIDNGFTVSTYATPRQLETDYDPSQEGLGPPLAIYTCAGGSDASGLSAQCDGGVCFTSTQGRSFPGFGTLQEDQIICSCPIVPSPPIGFQISGPWSCEPGDRNLEGRCCDQGYHDAFCGVDSATRTGTSIAVGAATGFAAILSKELDGEVPSVNRCVFR